jgi:hypothetical protein
MTRGSGDKVNYKRMVVEKAVNLMIIALSWLHLNKPEKAPSCLGLGAPLSTKQWATVKRLEKLAQGLAKTGEFGPSSMGRTAAKVESLAEILIELEQKVAKTLSPYEHRPAAQEHPHERASMGHEHGSPGRVVGSLPNGAPQLAKCVEPSRLSFPKEAPSFDPCEFLNEPHKSVYIDPISHADEPDWEKHAPPRVRIHASREQAFELLKFLDRHQRLRLIPEEKIRKRFFCDAFSLVKDEQKDRLILDARPPNLLESTLNSWTKTLGAISAVLSIELLPHCNLSMSGTDLRDYYYCFKVSKSRAARNTFNMPLKPKHLTALRCFHPDLLRHSLVYPCLSTMAMGDCQAVEIGQKVHVQLGLKSGLIHPSELLCVHGRAPRGALSCGIIIDDALFLEQVPATLSSAEVLRTEGVQRLRAMKEEYLRHDLTPHPDKTFEGEFFSEFWGASVDGVEGLVRTAPRRLVPLMDLTASTARLGFATVALLQTLAGAWVSVLQLRRRMMCLLDEIYVAQQGREATSIVEMSEPLVSELWLLVILAPLAVTDLRAQTLDELYLTDASEEMKASVRSTLSSCFSRELHRHSLIRGAWTKLLTPWKVWLQQHFKLEEEDALPDGVPLVSHPLWLVLATCLHFQVYHRRGVRDRRHINILELESILELEARISAKHQDFRYLCGSDSQIALAAVLKGRSSSAHLNRLLQKGLCCVLGAGIYGSYGYVPSAANPGDDPTRWTDVRKPTREVPEWLNVAFRGDFALFDRWLAELGYDPISVAQLPFDPVCPENAELLQRSLLRELRAVQKPDRIAVFDQKVYGSPQKPERPTFQVLSGQSDLVVQSSDFGHGFA